METNIGNDVNTIIDLILYNPRIEMYKGEIFVLYPVVELHRSQVGCYKLDVTLAEGTFREITPYEEVRSSR